MDDLLNFSVIIEGFDYAAVTGSAIEKGEFKARSGL